MSFPPKIPQKIILNNNRLTTIIGENLDVGDGERNGVGKSAIIDSILYLFFGRSPRVSNQGFLNYVDPGTMFVVGEASRNALHFRVERGENPSVLRLFEKPVGDAREWRTKENNKFIFETTKSSKPETTKRIVELMGFDLKLHDVLLVNNPSDRCCFFLKTEEDQRNIIERIFGFTVFTEKAEALRELRKEETKNLATKESAQQATRLANDRVLAQINILEEKSNAWAVEKDRLVKFLSQQIRTYQSIDFVEELKVLGEIDAISQAVKEIDRELSQHLQSHTGAEKRLKQWQSSHETEIAELNESISVLKTVDAEAEVEIIRKLLALSKTITEHKEKNTIARNEADGFQRLMQTEHIGRGRVQKEVESIEAQIIQLNESKCPTCGQDWADTQDHIVHCIADLDARIEEIGAIDKRLIEIKKEYSKAISLAEKLERQTEKHKEELDSLPTTTFTSIEDASKATVQLEQLVLKLAQEEKSLNPHAESLTEIKTLMGACQGKRTKLDGQLKKKPTTQFKSLQEAQEGKQNFETLTRQFEELSTAENPHRSTIDSLRNEVLQDIDDTEIRELKTRIEHMSLLIKLLSDRDSPIRTSILHEWLPELNDRVNRYIEFLELPHRIVFDPNMTAAFSLNGRELTFGNLSTGQRLRVWLATNMAFREIFELINYNINLFFVDEVLDKGMSARGAEVSYRLLEQMVEQNKSLFLITHRSELTDLADHIMTISLENGLSTIQ